MGQQLNNVVNLTGGLDLVSPHYVLQQQPGSARQLINFEASISAGYRRINGWERIGTASPTGGTDDILGLIKYADGWVACAATGVYYTEDGDTWTQVNRDTYVAQTGTVAVTDGGSGYVDVTGTGTSFTTEYAVGDHIRISGSIRQIASITSSTVMTLESEIAGGVVAGTAHYKNGTLTPTGTLNPRTGQGRVMIAIYVDDGEYGSIVMADESGSNPLAWFKIEGSGVNRTYAYDELTAADFAGPNNPKYVIQFKNRIVAFNDDDNAGNVTWSENLSNKRFDGASAGQSAVDVPVIGAAPLRDRVVLFCREAIYQLIEVDNSAATAILPVTYNIGCASGWSVQQLGGDLIFLAFDGIRTISTSDQYGDLQFGNIARKIDPLVDDLILNLNAYTISSTVFRSKNQYRLYYIVPGTNPDAQKALSGTLKPDASGTLVWQWNEIVGIEVLCLTSTTGDERVSSEGEQQFHGCSGGFIARHDYGNDFNGDPITAVIELNEVDYGDIGMKKTLHYVTVFGDVEESTVDDLFMRIVYDYNDGGVAQPGAYPITGLTGVSRFGEAVFGTSTFGGREDFSLRILVDGSGYSNSFIFTCYGTGGPFSINSLYTDIRVGPLL